VYEDKRYGVPLDVHSLAMYYNTEHFEKAGITEAPTDAASFEDALKKLKAAGYENPFWMPAKWPSHLMNLSVLWQNGGEPYNAEDAKATFDSEAGVEALEWQTSIIENGYSPKNVAIDAQYVAFKNGENSITWDGIWQFNDLEAAGVPYAAAPIPVIGEEDAVWANSHNFFLPRQAQPDENKTNAAKVFIAWMSENSDTWAGSGMIPARESVREAGALDGTSAGSHRREGRLHEVPASRPGSGHCPGRDARGRRRQRDPRRAGAQGSPFKSCCESIPADGRKPSLVWKIANNEILIPGGRLLEGGGARASADHYAHTNRGPETNKGVAKQAAGTPWLFLAPYLILFIGFVLIPIVFGLWISLHAWDYTRPLQPFVGLANYVSLFQPDSPYFESFWSSMEATGIFTVFSVPLLLTIPLAVALLMASKFPGPELLPRRVLRARTSLASQ
jgi:hypothetical protein